MRINPRLNQDIKRTTKRKRHIDKLTNVKFYVTYEQKELINLRSKTSFTTQTKWCTELFTRHIFTRSDFNPELFFVTMYECHLFLTPEAHDVLIKLAVEHNFSKKKMATIIMQHILQLENQEGR